MMEVARNSNQPLQPIPYMTMILHHLTKAAHRDWKEGCIQAAKIAANKATAHTAVCRGVIGI